MKILVCSDTHHCLSNLYDAIEREMPDFLIHLGDHVRDAEDVGYAFDRLEMICVPGNCDYLTQMPQTLIREIGGHRFLLAHGHNHGVKLGLQRIEEEGRRAGAEVVLFGHTHVPLCDRKGELWLMNPGACGQYRCTYGIITIDGPKLNCFIRKPE